MKMRNGNGDDRCTKKEKETYQVAWEKKHEKVRVNREREVERSKIKLTEEFVRRSWGRD
jgi:hypothetical protein